MSACCSSSSRKAVTNSIAFFNPLSQYMSSDRYDVDWSRVEDREEWSSVNWKVPGEKKSKELGKETHEVVCVQLPGLPINCADAKKDLILISISKIILIQAKTTQVAD